jgi:hypothetical protein
MGGVILKEDSESVPLDLIAGDGSILAQGKFFYLAGVLAADGSLKTVDSHGVGENGDGFPGVVCGYPKKGGSDPVCNLLKGLAAFGSPMGRKGKEGFVEIRVMVSKVSVWDIGQFPQMDLAKGGIWVEFKVFGKSNSLCGLLCTAQVAGIDGLDRNIPKAIFQGGDLFSAQSGHVPIIPPKNSAVQVALGLGVTDKIDSGHRGGPFFPGMI